MCKKKRRISWASRIDLVCQLCVSLHTALACLPRARAKRGGLSGRAGTCWTGKVTATWTPWPSSTQAPGQRKPLVADPDPVVSGSSCVCRCPHPSGPLGAEVDDQWSKKGRAGQQIAWPHSHPELPDYCSPRHLRNRKSGTLEHFFFFFFFFWSPGGGNHSLRWPSSAATCKCSQ